MQHTATHCNNTLHCPSPHSLLLVLLLGFQCNTLQHTANHYTILQHTATHCNTLQHTANHYTILQHTATLLYVVLQHAIYLLAALTVLLSHRLQYTATHCNTRQRTATHCNTVLQCDYSHSLPVSVANIVPRCGVAVCCNKLLCAIVCTLQCVAVCCSVLQCVAVCCSVLQRGMLYCRMSCSV